eukprot:7391557-Prymnesium_polylepis.1
MCTQTAATHKHAYRALESVWDKLHAAFSYPQATNVSIPHLAVVSLNLAICGNKTSERLGDARVVTVVNARSLPNLAVRGRLGAAAKNLAVTEQQMARQLTTVANRPVLPPKHINCPAECIRPVATEKAPPNHCMASPDVATDAFGIALPGHSHCPTGRGTAGNGVHGTFGNVHVGQVGRAQDEKTAAVNVRAVEQMNAAESQARTVRDEEMA